MIFAAKKALVELRVQTPVEHFVAEILWLEYLIRCFVVVNRGWLLN